MPSIPRRTFLHQLGAGGLGAVGLSAAGCATAPVGGSEIPLYIGTYTRGRSRGIYLGRFDGSSGRISVDAVVEGIENPSFLALHPAGTHLYAVSEVAEFAGTGGGGVVAYAIGPGTGLREINRQPSNGAAPCYVSIDATGRHLLVANYGGGNAAVLPIQADGSLGPASDVVQHSGSGPNSRRQEGPHAHFIRTDPGNRFAFVVDLGIDRVVGYRFDADAGKLGAAAGAGAAAKPGAGPRHLDFHPDGRRAYVINELDSTLTALAYDPATGSMQPTGTASTLPAGHTGANSCADVHVAPSGRFVYGSNRGHDSIAVFAIDAAGGAPVPVQHQSTLGRTPRNFAIDPAGRFLIAANQDSDSLVVFAIDPSSGRLSPVGDPVDVPVPVCVRLGSG
jgi:6-phosphogluconolactonase